jgi:hypothetical protein
LLISDSFVQSKPVQLGRSGRSERPVPSEWGHFDTICTGTVPKCPRSECSGRSERPDRPGWTTLECTNECATRNNVTVHYGLPPADAPAGLPLRNPGRANSQRLLRHTYNLRNTACSAESGSACIVIRAYRPCIADFKFDFGPSAASARRNERSTRGHCGR